MAEGRPGDGVGGFVCHVKALRSFTRRRPSWVRFSKPSCNLESKIAEHGQHGHTRPRRSNGGNGGSHLDGRAEMKPAAECRRVRHARAEESEGSVAGRWSARSRVESSSRWPRPQGVEEPELRRCRRQQERSNGRPMRQASSASDHRRRARKRLESIVTRVMHLNITGFASACMC